MHVAHDRRNPAALAVTSGNVLPLFLGVTEERVRELARPGTLRSHGPLVQPALIPGYTA
ncbi:MAG: hypothetical protein ACLP3C_22190 [Mycobacterium sp.]|uniref:hypothetical protein n=1 Tax=Mycobacterium sp. TaxID=1785 RepID=UPI003F967442